MKTFRICIILLALGGLVLPAIFFGGCSKTLEGDTYANEKPVVWFVNVPPENSQSSVNPIINWYGQDRDGQIDYYRYTVVREDDMGATLGRGIDWNPQADPLTETELVAYVSDHLNNLPDSLWTVLLVRADSTDPHTSNIIPMSAEMEDPVRTFVPQYVFVQAFDEEGLGSDMVYRRFLRNDNPPSTRIVGFIAGIPFINSVFPSGPATGIRLRWQGSDVIDYPTDAPPFEFQWKLFGPYSDDEYDELLANFRATVFVTNDARVFRYDDPPDSIGVDSFYTIDSSVIPVDTVLDSTAIRWLPTSLIICDTTFVGGVEIETCDTFPIVEFEGSNIYGTVDTLLGVYDVEFETGQFGNGEDYYRIVDSSHDEFGNNWITNERDTIYNAYWNSPADTTQAGTFIFVVRSRDDAKVPDLTPAWRGFTVINPQHERDILVMNWSSSAHENKAYEDSISAYWTETINNWIDVGHPEVSFDPDLDVRRIAPYVTDNRMLELILRYKVAIMVQDAAVSGTWSSVGEPVQNTMVALQTGVNVWVTMRVPLGSYSIAAGLSVEFEQQIPADYRYFFGVKQTTFPGWGSHIYNYFDGFGYGLPRTEHFIGTLSLDEDQWPELAVDTARLRMRYDWAGHIPVIPPRYNDGQPFYPYLPEYGALPQVGWCVRTFDTEAMYLFKSKYGNEHNMFTNLSFHGRPVGIRLNRGLFRTVHFMFTPLALEPTTGQEMVNGVMDWLYDGRTNVTSGGRANKQAALSSDLENRYWQCYWNANGDAEMFRELLKNAY